MQSTNMPLERDGIHTGELHMNTYTPAQLKKLMETLEQNGVTTERFQMVIGSGLVSDIFNPEAQIANRIAVRQALGLGALPSQLGRHVVNYGMDLEKMILAGNYDWRNDDITAKRFPIVGKGEVEFEDTIFHFDRSISSENAVKEILAADPTNPWEPAKIENLLAYGAKNPEEQRKFPIIGLGSVAKVNGNRNVPNLNKDGSKRNLNLNWWDNDWNGNYRFLAGVFALRDKNPAECSYAGVETAACVNAVKNGGTYW
jgi:hypothetical protein